MTEPIRGSITSFDEALAFLEAHEGDQGGLPFPRIEGTLGQLEILVDGARYNGTVPGELARGLWDLQEALYKAAAFALHQVDDIRKLTGDEREAFELVFKVDEGSTELRASLSKFLEKLAEGMAGMSDRSKVTTFVAIALIVTTGWAATSLHESSEVTKREEIKSQTARQERSEVTRQFEVFERVVAGSDVAQRFARASEEGARAVIRGAPDASQVRIGKARFSSAEIVDVNQRAKKTKSTAEVVREDFRIFGTESRQDGSTRYVLYRMADSAEFPVIVPHDEFSADDLDKLWKAAKERKPVKLEVSLTSNRGQVRTAQIVQVL